LFISAKHLTETIKELTGKTAGAWIDRTLALEAEMLLQHPDYSVQQVSLLLNFPDQSSFGKFFKKETGQSPTEYRKGNAVAKN
jgi:AraC-like DNA-binding protein